MCCQYASFEGERIRIAYNAPSSSHALINIVQYKVVPVRRCAVRLSLKAGIRDEASCYAAISPRGAEQCFCVSTHACINHAQT